MEIDKGLEEDARGFLLAEEGMRNYPYDDATGRPVKASGNVTIGIGRNLEANPLSLEEIDFLFRSDLLRTIRSCVKIYGERFHAFGRSRQLALISMAYQMGENGLLGFYTMNGDVRALDWESAANHALDSKWAKDFPKRAERTARMLRTNEIDGGCG